MVVVCDGISMYDMRTTFKGVTGEAVGYGEAVFVAQDGLIYLCDNTSGDLVHGWALTAQPISTMVTVVTSCRMEVDTAQTIGARVYSGEEAGGSAPSTTLTPDGLVCGIAITAGRVWVTVPQQGIDAPATG